MEKIKVGILDIETAPIVAYVWDRHDQNIAINQIKADWRIIAFAFKWLDGKHVAYHDARTEDKEAALLQKLWYFLDNTDVLITQNGKAFDSRKINARFIMHGMKPPSPYKHLDTYLIAKRAGAFTANSLEYLTDKLCTKYKKLLHKKFPGMSLWTECLKGNSEAWAEMKRYNIHDVLATEELYGKLKAWAPDNSPDVFAGDVTQVCGVCGGFTQKRGYSVVKGGKKARFHCQKCGRWQVGKKEKL